MFGDKMNELYMKKAFEESLKALKKDEVPVGCIIVKNNKIIAKAYNKKEKKKNATNHAEILCINKACKKMKDWRLDGCIMYVTLEPCMMCQGAINESRISKVFFCLKRDKKIKYKTKYDLIESYQHSYQQLIGHFFEKKRKK